MALLDSDDEDRTPDWREVFDNDKLIDIEFGIVKRHFIIDEVIFVCFSEPDAAVYRTAFAEHGITA